MTGAGVLAAACAALAALALAVPLVRNWFASITTGVWLLAEPYYNEKRAALRLRKVRLPPGEYGERAAHEAQQLSKVIQERAAVALPVDIARVPPTLEQATDRIKSELPAGVSLKLDLASPRIDRVTAAKQGLVAVARLTGRIGVNAE